VSSLLIRFKAMAEVLKTVRMEDSESESVVETDWTWGCDLSQSWSWLQNLVLGGQNAAADVREELG
jgi:hypothetical protein